jgi:hypothetical protein
MTFKAFHAERNMEGYESADRHKLTAQTKTRCKRIAPCYDVVD